MFYSLLFLGLLQMQVLHGLLPEESYSDEYDSEYDIYGAARILQNKETHLSEEPYVLFFYRRICSKEIRCAATLITDSIFITAAHCIIDPDTTITGLTYVTYDCWDVQSGDCKNTSLNFQKSSLFSIPPANWKFSPDYTPGENPTDDDNYGIAIVKLPHAIGMKPISLPSNDKKAWVPRGMADIVGYGSYLRKMEMKWYYWQLYQRTSTVPILDSCADYRTTGEKIVVKMPWSRANYVDIGGPLIIDNTLYGIGVGQNKDVEVKLYLNVNHYREFIDSFIEEFGTKEEKKEGGG